MVAGSIGPFPFMAKINRLPGIAVIDNSSNRKQISMFIDDSTLSEILNIAKYISNHPIGNRNLTLKRFQIAVVKKEWIQM